MYRLPLTILLSFLFFGFSSATIYSLTTADLSTGVFYSTLKGLKPGDVVNIHAGVYDLSTQSNPEFFWNGTLYDPIIVQAAGDGDVILTEDTSHNNINVGGQYFVLSGITFTGGSEGIRLGASSLFSTLGQLACVSNAIFQNLTVHDTQGTAITANFGTSGSFPGCIYTNVTFQHNLIYNTAGAGTSSTGECFYLGSSDTTAVFQNGFLLDNICHDNAPATQGSRAGIQIKPKSNNNLVQDNIIFNTVGPGILFYDDYNLGRNIAKGNLIYNAEQDNGIQVAAGATIVNNIVYSTSGAGIYIGDSADLMPGHTFRNVTVMHNTIISSSSTCLHFDSIGTGNNFLIANNAFFCATTLGISGGGISDATFLTNTYSGSILSGISAGGAFSSRSVSVELSDSANFNFFPAADSYLIGNGTGGSASVNIDFSYNVRSSTHPTIGAYEYSSTGANYILNPSNPSFKPTDNTSDGDGGSDGSAAATLTPFWML